jgi:hypothetical protein
MRVTDPSAPPTAISEETAEHGCVLASASHGGVRHLLSHADAWREGGVYVIRSSEFDVIAEHENFDQALDMFVTWLIDRAGQFAELVGGGEATEDERQTFAVLSARVFPLLHAAEQQQRRLHIRRRRATGVWRHQGTQASSSGRLSTA